jgi:hypothetical protein
MEFNMHPGCYTNKATLPLKIIAAGPIITIVNKPAPGKLQRLLSCVIPFWRNIGRSIIAV